MINLFDILQNAQGGKAFDNLAASFGLSPQQTQAAVESLLPAFSAGLQRQALNPSAFTELLGTMNAGAHRSAFEDAAASFGQPTANSGNDVLGALFGSKDASRAVANQAAAMSGVGADVLKAMLPVLASMLAGGITKTAQTQPQLGDIFGQIMGSFLGNGAGTAGAQPTPSQVQPNETGGGLLGALLGSILAQGNLQSGSAAPPANNAAPADASNPLGDLIGQMFQTGRQVQQSHADQMQAILDAFLTKKA